VVHPLIHTIVARSKKQEARSKKQEEGKISASVSLTLEASA
jgi:hypothetical protein